MDDIKGLQTGLANTKDEELMLRGEYTSNKVLATIRHLDQQVLTTWGAHAIHIRDAMAMLREYHKLLCYIPVLRRYFALISTSDVVAWKLAYIHGFTCPQDFVEVGNSLRVELARGPLADFLDTDWFRKKTPDKPGDVAISDDQVVVIDWSQRPPDEPTKLVGGRPMLDMGFKECRRSADGDNMDEVRPKETLADLQRDLNELVVRLGKITGVKQ